MITMNLIPSHSKHFVCVLAITTFVIAHAGLCVQLYLKIYFERGQGLTMLYVTQAGLELVHSSDLPLQPPAAGTTGVLNHTGLHMKNQKPKYC